MAKPLVAVTAIWEKDSKSDYPETVRIPMDDGRVITYRLDVEQPHPCFLNAIEILNGWPKGSYKYRGRKKAGACDGRLRKGKAMAGENHGQY